ncbi:MAG: NUDIX hydrolase [Chloroflexi bacterium]|nr:NUDIX hydrolase [Chloroflexota bacterium]
MSVEHDGPESHMPPDTLTSGQPVEGVIGQDAEKGHTRTSRSIEAWKTLSSKEVFDATPWLRVIEERVQLPDGTIVEDYYQLQMADSAVAIVTTPEDKLVMIEMYRHGPRAMTLLFPAGGIAVGEEPVDAAKRELLEETGYSAEGWRKFASFPGHTNQGAGRVHMYRAHNAVRVAEEASGDLESITTIEMTRTELTAAIKRGEMLSLGATAAAALFLGGLVD